MNLSLGEIAELKSCGWVGWWVGWALVRGHQVAHQLPNMDAPAERRERYSHTLDGAGYMGGGRGGGRPPTRLISNWRGRQDPQDKAP